MLFALLMTAQAGEMEITVPDPAAREVQLSCDGQQLTKPLVGGVAKFPGTLANCRVRVIREVGEVKSNDKWTCTDRGCTRNAIEHRNVGAAPGRVTIILTDASTSLLELRCPSGYRERAPVETNTAVFEGAPNEDCELFWKNSAPAKGRNLRPGTWYCQNTSGTGVCRRE